MTTRRCPNCQGFGYCVSISNKCPVCNGSGNIEDPDPPSKPGPVKKINYRECINQLDPALWNLIKKCEYYVCCTNPEFIRIYGHNFACKANHESTNIPDLCIMKQHFKVKSRKKGLEKFLPKKILDG